MNRPSIIDILARRAVAQWETTGRPPTGLNPAVERRALILAGAEVFGLEPAEIERQLDAVERSDA
jgi:hypothetical protein